MLSQGLWWGGGSPGQGSGRQQEGSEGAPSLALRVEGGPRSPPRGAQVASGRREEVGRHGPGPPARSSLAEAFSGLLGRRRLLLRLFQLMLLWVSPRGRGAGSRTSSPGELLSAFAPWQLPWMAGGGAV